MVDKLFNEELEHAWVKAADFQRVFHPLIRQLTARASDLITQKEAARLRGVKRQRINQLVNEGRIRATNVGNQIMVLREDVINAPVRKYKKKSDYWQRIIGSRRLIGKRGLPAYFRDKTE